MLCRHGDYALLLAAAVARENELLKHQLRKYVSAVQLLRQQGANDADFPGLHLDDVQPSIPSLQINTDFVQEAADYESKLIQVSECRRESKLIQVSVVYV